MNYGSILILLVGFSIVNGEKARFDNYRVYSIEVTNETQLKLLQELEDFQNGISFMKEPTTTGATVEIIIPPHQIAEIIEFFNEHKFQYRLKIENLQK